MNGDDRAVKAIQFLKILKYEPALTLLEKIYGQIDLENEVAFLQQRQHQLRENNKVQTKTARIFMSRKSTIVS